jgi:Protein of unknown function (DUF3800)
MSIGLSVREIFCIAFGKRKEGQAIAMWKVFLDDSGSDPQNIADAFVIAGFIGPEKYWDALEGKWQEALTPLSYLHTSKFLRDKDYSRTLSIKDKVVKLNHLAKILKRSELAPILSAVGWKDYDKYITGHLRKMYNTPYMLCAQSIIANTLRVLPSNEKVVFVFEHDNRHAEIISLFEKMFFESSIDPRLIGILKLKKHETCLMQPADYLAYATYQRWREAEDYPESFESIVTRPIFRDDGMVIGNIYNQTKLCELSENSNRRIEKRKNENNK